MICAHRACGCEDARVERDGKMYCSATCAQATEPSSGPCGCGHAHCKPEPVAPETPEERGVANPSRKAPSTPEDGPREDKGR